MSVLNTALVDAGFTAESRDAAIIMLVTEHGATINAATKAWATYAKEAGISKAKTSRKPEALEYIQGFDVTLESLEGIIDGICARFDVAPDTAIGYIKQHCKDRGIPYPVRDPRKAMFDWLIANAGREDVAEMKAEFKAYCKDSLNRSDSNINEYWKGYELHLAILAAQA